MSQIVRASVLLVALIVALLLDSCASGLRLPHSDQVTVTVAPAQSTVPVAGTLALSGNATGFTETPIVEWWVQEARDAGGSDDCGYLQPPLMSRCEFGFVIFGSVTQLPSSATYYAPLTPGTYHVTFEATQFATSDHVSKTATATITVTP
ncbi:MAG: hypothetical protein LAP86_31415 [Acidobacteriia bacterium]|nr:hypothetical protein [Terriglobia bacterium]